MAYFPTSPSVGDQYSFSGVTYQWDGTSWNVVSLLISIGNTTVNATMNSTSFAINGVNILSTIDGGEF